MSGPMHHEMTGVNNHVIHAYTYADSTERLAATGFTAEDVGKVAFQEDTQIMYILTDYDPITWAAIACGVAASGTFYAVDATGATVAITVVDGVITAIT